MVSARGRPHISSPHFAFFILLFIAAAHGTRHNHGSNQCHIGCHGSGGDAGLFKKGHSYEYRYQGSSRMKVGGTDEELAPLSLSATVIVTPVSSCNILLSLSAIQLTGPDNKVYDSGALQEGPGGLLAGLDSSGKLVGQICSPPDQGASYTNIHRAVLSLLQTHMPRHADPSLNATLHQTDVFGVCSTDYRVVVNKNKNKVEVVSSRDLDSCAHREEARLPLVTSPYHTKSGFDRSNILEGRLRKEQVLVDNEVEESRSTEFYTLEPLSDEAAASVTVTSQITLLKKTKFSQDLPDTSNYVGKSVIFEAVDANPKSSAFEEIKKWLMKLSEGKVTVIKEKSPQEFNTFVKRLAVSNRQDIITLLDHVKQGNGFTNKLNARRILLDGLVESASSTSVEVMAELLKTGEVTGIQAKMWLMSFPNTKQVSADALSAAKVILESEGAPVQAYLGIGALVGKYCVQHNCQGSDIVNSIEDLMAKPLFESCKPSNYITENNLLAGLKGLGNIRFLSDKVAQRLSECALDKEAWVRVRVAALDTMRTHPNKPIVRQTAEKILKDTVEDSELRIKAYLVLVESPSGQVAEIIKDLLSTEKSHQVGGFIVSHLRNIRSSTNPDKEGAQHHLGGIYTRAGRFGWDPKRYSQHYELSYSGQGDTWGVAGESSILYSHQGYLPRSLHFNLTTLLHGHSFNLFEIGIRTENTERIFENLIKKLTLKRENVNELLKNGTDMVDELSNKLSHTLRPKRSLHPDKINNFFKNVKKPADVYHDELLFDLSVKSLGAEIGFFSHLGDDIGPHKSIDQLFSGLQYSIDNAKNLNLEYSKHTTFLEGEVIYPTGMGLPMRVKTKGSAAFGLTTEAKLDLPAIIQNPLGSHHFKFKFIPSGSVEVIGSVTMDAMSVESGVEVSLTGHSSTGGDLKVRLNKGRELEVELGVPLREQRIISASTGLATLFRHHHTTTTSPIQLDINKVSIEDYSGCFEQLVSVTGLTLCGEVSMPNNNAPTLNPLYGPSKLSLSVHIEDETLTSYVLKASYDHVKDKNKRKLHILLDTPGSKVNRKMSFGYESESNDEIKNIKFHHDSFWKSMSIQGSVMESEKEVSVSGRVKYDELDYSGRVGLTVSQTSPTVTIYKPFLHYNFPQYHARLIGRSTPTSPHIKLSGEVIVERKEEEGLTTYLMNRLTVEGHKWSYVLDGSVSSQVRGHSRTLTSDLKLELLDGEYVTLNSSLSCLDNSRLEGSLQVFPSQAPDLAFNVNGKVEYQMNQDFKFMAEADFTHGPNPNDKDLRFTFENEILISGVRENSISYVAIKHFVGYPPAKLHFLSDFEWLPKKLKYNLVSKLDESNADFKLTASTDQALPYDIYLAAKIMNKGFKLEARREMIEPCKSKFTNSLEIFPEKLFQVNALVSHKFAWSDLDFSIQSEIKTPLTPKHIRVSIGAQNNDDRFLAQYFLEADSKVLVDFFTERFKGPESKGNIRLLLTGYVDSKGDFGYQDSNLKGSGYILFVRMNNKIDASVDMVMKYPKYGGTIDLIWTSNPQDTKVLKIITETNLENSAFDTKNKIIYNGQENQINLFVKKTKAEQRGTMDITLELKLGEMDHAVTKYRHNVNMVPGDSEGEYSLDVRHKASATANPTRISITLTGSHVDFQLGKVDAKLSALYTTPQSSDVSLQIAHKKMPLDDKWIINTMMTASGSLMESPLNLKLDCELSRSLLADSVSWSRVLPPSSYRVSASFGPDTSLESYGKVTGHTFSGEVSVTLPPGFSLSSFKWTTVNLAQLHPGPDSQRQIKMSNVFKWNNKFFAIDNEFILESEGGSIKFDWESNSTQKRSLYVTSHWPMKDRTVDFDITFKYDKDGKTSDALFKYVDDSLKGENTLQFHGTCPANGVYDLKIVSKYSPASQKEDGRKLHTEWILLANNKTTKGLLKILPVKNHPYIEYYIEDENNAKSGFLIKADKKGVADWTANAHVEWAMEGGKKGFFYVNSEVKLISADNFMIRLEANSNKYNLKDLVVDLHSDKGPGKPARSVVFTVHHQTATILNATASYDLNYVKNGVYKIEARGDAWLDGTVRPISLKAVWKPSEPRKEFNGSLVHGENTIMIESVVDESEVYYVRKYCSPKLEKKCSEARIIWKSVEEDADHENKMLEVVLDLSSMDPTLNDFTLKAQSKRDRSVVDHKLELQWFKNRMFTYKAYVHEDKAGLTIGLPKRIISGDVAFQVPRGTNQGRLFIEANLWLNKQKEPEKKTYFLLSGELSRDKEQYALTTESKLSHPSLLKNFSLKGKATVGKSWTKPKSDGHFEFDVFKKTEDMILLTWNMGNNDEKGSYSAHNIISAKSKGLKLDAGYERRVAMSKTWISWSDSIYYVDESGVKKEMAVKVDIKPRKLLLSLSLPEVSLYAVNFSLERRDKGISILGTYHLAGATYRETIHINNFNNVNYQFHYGKGQVFNLDFGLALGQIAEIKASLNQSPMYEWEVALNQADFLKTKYNYNKDTFKKFCETIGEEMTIITNSYDKEVRRAVDRDGKALSQLVQRITKAVADPTPLLISYQQDVQTLLEEILQDEAFKQALIPMRELLSSALEQCVEIIEEVMRMTTDLRALWRQIGDYAGSVIESISAKVKETSNAVSSAVARIIDSFLEAYLAFLDQIFNEINKHHKQIKAVTTALSEFVEDMGRLFIKFANQLKKELEDFVRLSWEEFKQMPLFQVIEEKMQELKNYKVSEGFWPDLQEILRMVADAAPNPELRKFITTVTDYIDQYLKEENLDLDVAVRQIYSEFIASIKPTLDSIYDALSYEETLFNNNFWIPLPWVSLWKTGSTSTGGIKLSTIKWLLSADLPTFIDYGLQSWNSMCHLIPPYKARAYMIDSEMTTFDGKEVSLEDGTYVLVQELNNKFSVVAEIKSNKILTIQLTKGADYINLTPDGKIWVNGKEVEYGTKDRKGGAGGRYTTKGSDLESEEVVMRCFADISSCHLSLRAPAFARVRGLLGTYNYESFDDFTLPNGTISNSKEEFVQSWRVEGEGEVKRDHLHQSQQKCTQMYTSSNHLMLCYRLVDPKPFRGMCDHLVERAKSPEAKKKALCQSVRHYTSACRANNLKIDIPPPCDVCDVDGTEVTLPEVKSLPVQQKKADVVFVVELKSDNQKLYQDLIRPLTKEIKKQLASSGISDVEFGLVGYGTDEHRYINYFKVNGKLQLMDSLPSKLPWGSLSRGIGSAIQENATLVDKFLHTVDKFFIADDKTERGIVRTWLTKAYPWRSGSHRSLVSLVSSPCPLPEPILSPLTRIKMAQRLQVMKSYGIVYNLISPVHEIDMPSGNTNDILGFNKEEVFMVNDIKGGKAAQDRRKEMTYDYDACHLFPLETGGNIFVSNNLMKGKSSVEGVANRVVQSMAEHKVSYECQCAIIHGLYPRYECTVPS